MPTRVAGAWLGACCLGLSLSLAAGLSSLAAAESRPNILFIAIDDLRDWIGCLGTQPAARTPHLDRLAARGTLFTRAYCPAPWCNPSRTALLTGVRPSTSGVYTHYHVPWRDSPVLKHAVTLPRHFRDHGYWTGGAGKIFHHDAPSQDPDSWDDYWPSKTQCMLNMPQARPPLNGMNLRSSVDWGPTMRPKEEMPDWKVADWVVAQLLRTHDRPFFLACGFYRPHLPWYVPQEYFDRHPRDTIQLPPVKDDDLDDVGEFARRIALGEGLPHLLDPRDYGNSEFPTFPALRAAGRWREALQAYLASVSFADDCLGRVLDALDRSPHKDNTIVVLWSDHGWHLGEKLHWEKTTLWEEAAKCVLLIAAPGMGQPGQRCAAPVNLLDLYPTLVELAALPPRPGLEGASLVPLLRDPQAVWTRPSLTTHGRGNHSVRTARWCYIRYANGEEELYDHDADPHEWRNLARDEPWAAVKRELAAALPKEEAPPINDYSHTKLPPRQGLK
jgi:arylsulfatase A-like enzyme